MFKKVPQLKEYDKEKVDDYFKVVKTFSPIMATNPVVAGNLVNKMILNDGVDSRLIGEIAGVQKVVERPMLGADVGADIMQRGISAIVPTGEEAFGDKPWLFGTAAEEGIKSGIKGLFGIGSTVLSQHYGLAESPAQKRINDALYNISP